MSTEEDQLKEDIYYIVHNGNDDALRDLVKNHKDKIIEKFLPLLIKKIKLHAFPFVIDLTGCTTKKLKKEFKTNSKGIYKKYFYLIDNDKDEEEYYISIPYAWKYCDLDKAVNSYLPKSHSLEMEMAESITFKDGQEPEQEIFLGDIQNWPWYFFLEKKTSHE